MCKIILFKKITCVCVRENTHTQWSEAEGLKESAAGNGCRFSSQRMWSQPLGVMIAPMNGTLTLPLAAPDKRCFGRRNVALI